MNKNGIIVTDVRSRLGFSVTTGTIDLICAAVELGMDFETAAVACGLSTTQARKMVKDAAKMVNEDPKALEFTENYRQLLEYMVDHVMQAQAKGEMALLKTIQEQSSRDWKAAAKLLEYMRPARYGKKAVIYGSGLPASSSNKNKAVDEMSDDELRDIIDSEYQEVEEANTTNEEYQITDELPDSSDKM